MNQQFEVDSLDDLNPIAREIIGLSDRFPVILFKGEMGTGKTTLIAKTMSLLGMEDTSSPTFSLVNRYDTDQGTWYHFDLYRIEDDEELLDFGFEEYIGSGNPCLIEWPQIASKMISPPHLLVEIQLSDNLRIVTLSQIEQ